MPTLEFESVEVAPNENSSVERSVNGVGRFDIFLSAVFKDNLSRPCRLQIVFELKIDSRPNAQQSRRYAEWLFANHPGDINLLIYLTPQLRESAQETTEDKRWYCLDYQLLHDKLLFPLLDHPKMNDKVKPFIVQYIKNLKINYRGIKMAITNEEKQMAVTLYEKYNDVFDSIYEALVATGTIVNGTAGLTSNRSRESGRIDRTHFFEPRAC